MKLCKSESVCILDDDGVDIWYVNACFNNRCAHKHINFTLKQSSPDVAQLILRHLTVCNGNCVVG